MSAGIDLALRPLSAYRVRKRRKGDGIYLIDGSRLVRIDGFTEHLWLMCDGTRPLVDVVGALRDAYPGQNPVRLVELVFSNILYLQDEGMLSLVAPGEGAPDGRGMPPCRTTLLNLMNRFALSRDLGWESRAEAEFLERAIARFCRILYEGWGSRGRRGSDSDGERRFVEGLAAAYTSDPVGVARSIERDHGLRWWRPDVDRNQIEMVFTASVYRGDVGTRT